MSESSTGGGLLQGHMRNAAIAAASVVAVGLGVWLLVSSSSPSSAASSSKAKKSKKTKKPLSAETEREDAVTPVPQPVAEDAQLPTAEPQPTDPVALAKDFKTKGNRLFGERKYAEAIDLYSKAIELDATDPVFFANRAACYANLDKHAETIADCDAALKLDDKYVKAVYRRAQAYHSLGKLDKALEDYTVICMLEEFKKETSVATTDKVLKELGEKLAKEHLESGSKTKRLPSETFVKAYMDSFRPKNFGESIVRTFPKELAGDALLHAAFDAVIAKDWETAIASVEKALTEEMTPSARAFALNTVGTFCFLKGDIPLALEFLDKSLEIDPKALNTIIKRASLFMEKQDLEAALKEYERAEAISTTDPDLYYHRGQVRFLTGDINSAIADYKKSLSLDNEFVYAHIQLAVAMYKNEDQSGAEKVFLKALRKFADSPEVYNYYGEVLLDQQRFEDALTNFDKAISMDGSSPLPYINKSILFLQAKGDPKGAEEFCKKASEVDPTCDIAFIQLAQILIHQNRLQEALEAYEKAVQVTRTEPELVNAISCREACRAQLYVSQKYPDVYAKLRSVGM